MITDEVDGVVRTVDDVDDAIRHAGLLQQVDENHAGCRVPLRGLHDVGVAADGADREHPGRVPIFSMPQLTPKKDNKQAFFNVKITANHCCQQQISMGVSCEAQFLCESIDCTK